MWLTLILAGLCLVVWGGRAEVRYRLTLHRLHAEHERSRQMANAAASAVAWTRLRQMNRPGYQWRTNPKETP